MWRIGGYITRPGGDRVSVGADDDEAGVGADVGALLLGLHAGPKSSVVVEGLVDSVKCLVEAGKLNKHALAQNEALLGEGEGSLAALLRCSALDAVGNGGGLLRVSVCDVLRLIMENETERDYFVDVATLQGVAIVLLHLKKQAEEEKEKTQTGLRSRMITCLKVIASIFEARPENYQRADAHCRETMPEVKGVKMVDLCLETMEVFRDGAFDCSELVDSFVKVVVYNWEVTKDVKEFEKRMQALRSWGGAHDPATAASVNDCLGRILSGPTREYREKLRAIKEEKKKPDTAVDSAAVTTGKEIRYRCDGCELFPIKGVRYSGEGDLDLCRECYDTAVVENASRDGSGPAVLKGKGIGPGMTVNELMMLGPIEVAAATASGRAVVRGPEEWQCNVCSLINVGGGVCAVCESPKGVQGMLGLEDYESSFMEGIESSGGGGKKRKVGWETEGREGGVGGEVEKEEAAPPNEYADLISFVLTSTIRSFNLASGALTVRSELALLVALVETNEEEYVKPVVEKLSNLAFGIDGGINEEDECLVLVYQTLLFFMCGWEEDTESFRGAGGASPADAEKERQEALLALKDHDKTDPRFVCAVHNVPAVRRRCSQGKDINRRFYLCGMPRQKRCNYFAWADGGTGPSPVTLSSGSVSSRNNPPGGQQPAATRFKRVLKNKSVCTLLIKGFEEGQAKLLDRMLKSSETALGVERGVRDVEGVEGGGSKDSVVIENNDNRFVGGYLIGSDPKSQAVSELRSRRARWATLEKGVGFSATNAAMPEAEAEEGGGGGRKMANDINEFTLKEDRLGFLEHVFDLCHNLVSFGGRSAKGLFTAKWKDLCCQVLGEEGDGGSGGNAKKVRSEARSKPGMLCARKQMTRVMKRLPQW